MRGTDPYHRPFVAMKLHQRDNPTDEIILVLFQRATKQSSPWCPSFCQIFRDSDLNPRPNDLLQSKDLTQIDQILSGQHEQLILAEDNAPEIFPAGKKQKSGYNYFTLPLIHQL